GSARSDIVASRVNTDARPKIDILFLNMERNEARSTGGTGQDGRPGPRSRHGCLYTWCGELTSLRKTPSMALRFRAERRETWASTARRYSGPEGGFLFYGANAGCDVEADAGFPRGKHR